MNDINRFVKCYNAGFHPYYGFDHRRPLLFVLRARLLGGNMSEVSEIIANRAYNKIVNNIPFPDLRPTEHEALSEIGHTIHTWRHDR
jgi:hypothetical protein